ncbi:hypothetical protein [Novipirellula aureliae]|uniref:hypothetical protein n=1 Tax=Novipirellula aureliae TaxID=2527966 RepID=UPI0018CDE264|nr:hypothetical protein [Novipirellula aureliae]
MSRKPPKQLAQREGGCLYVIAACGLLFVLITAIDVIGIGMAYFLPWLRQWWQ